MTKRELIERLGTDNMDSEIHLAVWPVRENPPTIFDGPFTVYHGEDLTTIEVEHEAEGIVFDDDLEVLDG